MAPRTKTYKYLFIKSDNVISSHYTLSDLYRAHTDKFKNENQLRGWSVGRSQYILPRSYRLMKL